MLSIEVERAQISDIENFDSSCRTTRYYILTHTVQHPAVDIHLQRKVTFAIEIINQLKLQRKQGHSVAFPQLPTHINLLVK